MGKIFDITKQDNMMFLFKETIPPEAGTGTYFIKSPTTAYQIDVYKRNVIPNYMATIFSDSLLFSFQINKDGEIICDSCYCLSLSNLFSYEQIKNQIIEINAGALSQLYISAYNKLLDGLDMQNSEKMHYILKKQNNEMTVLTKILHDNYTFSSMNFRPTYIPDYQNPKIKFYFEITENGLLTCQDSDNAETLLKILETIEQSVLKINENALDQLKIQASQTNISSYII